MTAAAAPPLRFAIALAAALGVWAVGVQVNEGLASAGAIATTLFAAIDGKWGGCPFPAREVLRRWAPLWAFLLWGLVVSPLLAGTAPSGSGAARLIDWLGVPAAAWAVQRLGARALRRVALAAGLTLALSCLCAGLQHYGLWPAREAFAPLAWTQAPFDRVYEAAPGDPNRFLAGGLLFHRLRFAHLTALAGVLALGGALRTHGPTRVAFAAAAGVALCSVALFPGARAAFVAAGVAYAVQVALLAESSRTRAALIGGTVLAAALLLAGSPSMRARLATAATVEGRGDRAGLLDAGLAAVRAHPLSGVGAGRFRPADWAPETATALAKEHGGKSHNQLVTLAAETGVPGAALFVLFLAVLARWLWRGGADGRLGLGALSLLALLCALHDPLFHAEVSLGFTLALGAALGLSRRR